MRPADAAGKNGRRMTVCSVSRWRTSPMRTGLCLTPPYMYTTSFLANQNGRGRTCKWCLETDHAAISCTLAPPSNERLQSRSGLYGRERESDPIPIGDCRAVRFGRGEVRGDCFVGNEGYCAVPYCRWRHVCRKCGSADHRESN